MGEMLREQREGGKLFYGRRKRRRRGVLGGVGLSYSALKESKMVCEELVSTFW